MDNERVKAAKRRVAERAALREEAAARAESLPPNYRRSLLNQFQQGTREAQFITRVNQGRPLND